MEGDAYKCEPRHGYKAFIDGETVPSDYYETAAGGKRLDKITRCVDKRTPDFTIRGPNPSIYRQARAGGGGSRKIGGGGGRVLMFFMPELLDHWPRVF